MVNFYTLGFVGVAAVFAAGADYVVQSNANGTSVGAYPVGDYFGSYAPRLRAALADLDKSRRQAEAARSHLPEAVAGFERRNWERDGAGDEALTAGMSFLERRAFGDALKAARKAARQEVYEYARGGEVLRLSARFEPAPKDGRTARVTAFVAPGVDVARARLEGYDIVQGVPFFRVIDTETGLGADPAGPLMLQAFLGDGVAIGVHAEHPVADLARVLAAIDYDSLNAMLDRPLEHVGHAALPMSAEQKKALLEAAAAIYMSDAGTPAEDHARPAAHTLAEAQTAPATARPSVGQQRAASADKPRRLTLSGGRTCLGSASGRLCD